MISLLLPSPGDPLLLDVWYSNFKKYQHLVDECLICINHLILERQISEETLQKLNEFYENFQSDKVKVFYKHNVNNHGEIIKFLYEKSKGDIIFLMEDDNFIFDVDELENNLEKVKSNECDIIGVVRDCCSDELSKKFREKYKRKHIGFWPTYFICKKSLLNKTELNFSERIFNSGLYIKELDFTPDKDLVSDTMVYLSLQLNSFTDKIFYHENSYHSNIDDFKYLNNEKHISDLHIGSLSSTFNILLFDKINDKYIQDFIDFHKNDKNTILEYFRRFIFLNCLIENIDVDKFYYKKYKDNIDIVFNCFDDEHKIYFDRDIIKFLIKNI